MNSDFILFRRQPGIQGGSPAVGGFKIRSIELGGNMIGSQRLLDIGVEAFSSGSLHYRVGDDERAYRLEWLSLSAELTTIQAGPPRTVGRILIDDKGFLPIADKAEPPGSWQWALSPHDVEVVESARSSAPDAPIQLALRVEGIAKGVDHDSPQVIELTTLQSGSPSFSIELSHRNRLLTALGYGIPPSQAAFAGTANLDHPAWKEATSRLAPAREHLRIGQDDDALRDCLNAFEGIVSAPYKAESWLPVLVALPDQKVDGLARLFSGLATYCNKVGHHRSRGSADQAGDNLPIPLDHWEAELITAQAQFAVAYALRLRSSGALAPVPDS